MNGLTLATTHNAPEMLGGQYTWVVPWPPLLTVLVVVAASALVYWSHRRQRFRREWHRWLLVTIRYVCILLVLFMCYRFSHHNFRFVAPDVVVCVDTSTSMKTVDAYTGQQSARILRRTQSAGLAEPSRINQAKALLLSDTRTAKAFRRRYRVKYRSLTDPLLGSGDDANILRAVSADQPTSPIGDMILAGLNEQRGTPTAAIVVLTDGINTQGASFQHVTSMAERRSVPIYTIALGSERPTRDIEVRAAWADPIAFVNDVVSVSCTVSASGFDDIVDRKQIEIRLTKAGEEEVVSKQSVELSKTPQTVQFMVTPKSPGRHNYIISTDVVEGEVNVTNNEDIVSVDVRDEMIQVLIASSQPNYEYRFLKSLLDRESLKSNASVRVSTFLQDGDPELSRVDQTAVPLFPSSREQLLSFDVFICIDLDVGMIGSQSKSDFVDAIVNQGRSTILIFGNNSDAISTWSRDNMLSKLLPFRVAAGSTGLAGHSTLAQDRQHGATKLRLTVDGETAANMQLASDRESNRSGWSELPELFNGDSPIDAPTNRLRRSCRVLAEFQRIDRPLSRRRPAITLHYAGAGQVLFHAIDQTWRWRYRRNNEVFGRYWLQSMRMLSRNKLLSESPADLAGPKGDLREGDEIPFRVILYQNRDETESGRQRGPYSLVVESTLGKVAETPLTPSPTQPNRLSATLSPLPPGRYDVWLRSPSIEPRSVRYGLVVTALESEQTRIATDFDVLETMATRTGGKAYTEKNADRLFRELPDPQSLQRERLPARPIWNSPWLAILIVGLLSIEWTIRRSSGLP